MAALRVLDLFSGIGAKERAVEAGARAIAPHALMKDSPALKSARADARAVLRAAFPILAEELVAWHDEQAAHCQKQEPDAAAGYVRKSHERHAANLRARIQQMAEAL